MKAVTFCSFSLFSYLGTNLFLVQNNSSALKNMKAILKNEKSFQLQPTRSIYNFAFWALSHPSVGWTQHAHGRSRPIEITKPSVLKTFLIVL